MMLRGIKKLDLIKLSSEEFERKPYFDSLNLELSRVRFRIEAKLVPTILGNQPSRYRRRGLTLSCPSCSLQPPRETGMSAAREPAAENSTPPPIHSQSHLLSGDCEGVSDLLIDCDTRDDKSLAIFFQRVVARNMEIEGFEYP